MIKSLNLFLGMILSFIVISCAIGHMLVDRSYWLRVNGLASGASVSLSLTVLLFAWLDAEPRFVPMLQLPGTFLLVGLIYDYGRQFVVLYHRLFHQ